MKKFLLLLMSLLLLFAFVACDDDDLILKDISTDAEVLTAYEDAVEAYGWFHISTMPMDFENSAEKDGMTYFKVDDFETKAQLEKYLLTLFDDDIVEDLMKTPIYVEIDGKLYGTPADRGSNIYRGEDTQTVVHRTDDDGDDDIYVSVEVEVLGDDLTTVIGTEIYEFEYEEDDGNWVFSEFELVR